MPAILYLDPRHFPHRITDAVAAGWAEEMHSFYGGIENQPEGAVTCPLHLLTAPTPDEIRQAYFDALCAPGPYFNDEPEFGYNRKADGYIDTFIMSRLDAASYLDSVDRGRLYDWVLTRRLDFKSIAAIHVPLLKIFTLTPEQHMAPKAMVKGRSKQAAPVIDEEFSWPKKITNRVKDNARYGREHELVDAWCDLLDGWIFDLPDAPEAKVVRLNSFYTTMHGVKLYVHVWIEQVGRFVPYMTVPARDVKRLAHNFRREE